MRLVLPEPALVLRGRVGLLLPARFGSTVPGLARGSGNRKLNGQVTASEPPVAWQSDPRTPLVGRHDTSHRKRAIPGCRLRSWFPTFCFAGAISGGRPPGQF